MQKLLLERLDGDYGLVFGVIARAPGGCDTVAYTPTVSLRSVRDGEDRRWHAVTLPVYLADDSEEAPEEGEHVADVVLTIVAQCALAHLWTRVGKRGRSA
jgi:hypothetical protein